MSIIERFKTSRIGQFWLKYNEKIVLGIGIILIAAVSFEAGFLHGQKNKQASMVVSKIESAELMDSNRCNCDAQNENAQNSNSSSSAQIASTENTAVSTLDNQKCAYVASKNSNKYHLPTCRYAQNIKAENKICFSSKEEAESRGFQGAKCCIK